MVYIDNFNAKYRNMIMCHMIADSKEELLAMADKIGVQRKWIQDEDTYSEHFDVSLGAKKKGLQFGATEINFRQYARMCNLRQNAPDFLKEWQREIDEGNKPQPTLF